MKICPTCQSQLDDQAAFCPNCGVQFTNQPPAQPGSAPQQGAPASPVYIPVDPFDHTAAFDPKDISDNKVFSMLAYLLGTIGIIIALLAANSSPYTAFHVRQSLKITVVTILSGIIAMLLCWTIIVPIAYVILLIVLFVVKIICFFQVCSGKAVEPAIVRSLKFLK